MHNQIRSLVLLSSLGLASAVSVLAPRVVDVDSCPGYSAKNVKESSHGFVADLTLAGKACNIYGTDLKDLKLEVTYDSGWFPRSAIIITREMKLRDGEMERWMVEM